jgi:RHS repeat-associated protein
LIDPNNHTGYAQVLEEFYSIGAPPSRSYVIGDDVLGQCSASTTDPRWFLYDGHGSTRQLSNPAAGVSSDFNYDAYGITLANSSSSGETTKLYCGEQFDLTLGMYNLRTRYYDPSNGRFNALDSFRGSNFDPQGLHKYAYGSCDPINRCDPSGQISALELLIVTIIIVIIVVELVTFAFVNLFRSYGISTFYREGGYYFTTKDGDAFINHIKEAPDNSITRLRIGGHGTADSIDIGPGAEFKTGGASKDNVPSLVIAQGDEQSNDIGPDLLRALAPGAVVELDSCSSASEHTSPGGMQYSFAKNVSLALHDKKIRVIGRRGLIVSLATFDINKVIFPPGTRRVYIDGNQQ